MRTYYDKLKYNKYLQILFNIYFIIFTVRKIIFFKPISLQDIYTSAIVIRSLHGQQTYLRSTAMAFISLR